MNAERLKELLSRVAAGDLAIEDAARALRDLPFADLGFANVDHHRALRTGMAEVILGEPKTVAQIAGIASELVRAGANVLITRLSAEKATPLLEQFPAMRYAAEARVATLELTAPVFRADRRVAVVTGGTGDLPVAEEAVETLRMLAIEPVKLYDVGVAGIHRLLDRRALLDAVQGIIVVAGMEGALASVVGGLTGKPLVAVPTSVGYGAHLQGITPLFAMLSSCASGIVVVNIDNGFGAAMAMGRILPKG